VTIHGPMVARFSHSRPEDLSCLRALLSGEDWRAPSEMLTTIVSGEAEGFLIGGNLCVLSHLAGALPARTFQDAILVLEEIAEAPYRVDRMLTQIRRAGFLDHIRGVVLGDFTRCDPGADGTSCAEVLHRHLCASGVPVISGYPAAHGGRNWPFLHGARVHLIAPPGEHASLKLSR